MHSRIEKVRTHLRDNKKAYIAGATCFVAGAATTIIVLRSRTTADMNVKNQITQILAWKPEATLEVHIEALGDPGNIIQDTTTGTIYASQGQAARELGVTPSEISKHLAGKRAHINGHTFEKLGKAAVSQE